MAKGYIDPNWPNPNGPGDASIIIYGYTPSKQLAIFAISLFSILLLGFSIRIIRLHLWSYVPIIIACILEVIGYSFRYLSGHTDPYRISFFVIQYFCITVAPVFIAASIYVYFTHLATCMRAESFPIGLAGKLGHRAVLWIFITADVLCTLLQVTGAALIGSKTSKHQDPATANRILVAGLAAQTVAFTVFLILLTSLVIATFYGQRTHSIRIPLVMKQSTLALSFAGVLIMLRTVFRLIESGQGVFGYLSSHEVFFGTLEFAPVGSALITLAVFVPPRLRKGKARKDITLNRSVG